MTATVARTHARQWGDVASVDTRVSHAEQQDHMPQVGAPEGWMVAALACIPLLMVGAGALIALYYR